MLNKKVKVTLVQIGSGRKQKAVSLVGRDNRGRYSCKKSEGRKGDMEWGVRKSSSGRGKKKDYSWCRRDGSYTARYLGGMKNQIECGLGDVYGKVAHRKLGYSTPVNLSKSQQASLKKEKYINSERSKNVNYQTKGKRSCRSKRKDTLEIKILEGDDALNTEISQKKSALNSYISQCSKLSKVEGSYKKIPTKKKNYKTTCELSYNTTTSKNRHSKRSPKESITKSFASNTQSLWQMEGLKYSNKIRPILISSKLNKKKSARTSTKRSRKGTATNLEKSKSVDNSDNLPCIISNRKETPSNIKIEGQCRTISSSGSHHDKKRDRTRESHHFEINLYELDAKIRPWKPKPCIRAGIKQGKEKIIKTVSFAEKLIVNEDSLDSEMMERIHHNLEYNDDRIFENLSIFQQLSGENCDAQPTSENSQKDKDKQGLETSKDQPAVGDSGNKDYTDIEQNQGILSSYEESGIINESKRECTQKEPIFESQVSAIERMEDTKEAYEISKGFSNLGFDKCENQENSSGFIKLNDSLIKSREVWKDKSTKRESIKQLNNSKNKDCSLQKSTDQVDDCMTNNKQSPSLIARKEILEEKSKPSKDLNTDPDRIKKNSSQINREVDIPNENFFEEKGSESIIEKNDEESKFVDEESYSMVYLTKQQNSNNPQFSIKLNCANANSSENNTKELSIIEDIEDRNENNDIQKIKLYRSKEKQDEGNSMNQINSQIFKGESTISYNQDQSKIELYPEKSDTIGLILEEECKSKPENQDNTAEKYSVQKEISKKAIEFGSLSEIFGDKIDFDMSTIKEMVESCEVDSFYFANSTAKENKLESGLKFTQREDKQQNNFDKIIKYMKKEVLKMDTIKRSEKNPEKLANILKNFIQNLKKIEISPKSSQNPQKLLSITSPHPPLPKAPPVPHSNLHNSPSKPQNPHSLPSSQPQLPNPSFSTKSPSQEAPLAQYLAATGAKTVSRYRKDLSRKIRQNKSHMSENSSHETFKKYWSKFFGQ
ncbi:unnamed protein product [Moneuplotes crassus]|uniref:Uncharacterized protein n=1 Tax=Euplotes crassus TaxID=5936 RepID=A0AAD1XJQ6_EUPCR|nr:unnamed protein product [Moneuplotes crassus]